jgi:hypothetical protein
MGSNVTRSDLIGNRSLDLPAGCMVSQARRRYRVAPVTKLNEQMETMLNLLEDRIVLPSICFNV